MTTRSFRFGKFGLLLGIVACSSPGSTLSPDDTGGDPRQSQLSDSVSAMLRTDAIALAVRQLRSRAPEVASVEIPAALVDELFSALSAVYRSTSPARDSVAAIYRIRAFPETQEIIVTASADNAWIDAWRRGNRLTGNAAVDSLMQRYALTLVRTFDWSIGRTALLGTTRPLNVQGLATLFAKVPGVRFAEPNAYGGDGNNIVATASAIGWQLDYSVGFGDCPAGCISRRFWTFVVSATGAVTYVGSRGAPAPPPGSR